MEKIKSLGADSRYKGCISKGCHQCAKGQKMVLFITGKCNFNCFYCPISIEKKDKDVIFANERKISDTAKGVSELLEEAVLTDAKGTGITGGDPIKVFSRTLKFIRILKENFGEKHHIHLYTSTPLNKTQITSLEKAGLDEIRFHIPVELWVKFENSEYYKSISLLFQSKITPAVEIPLLPDRGKEMKKLIMELDKINLPFINLNELEISETNSDQLNNHNYKTEKNSLVGVSGSRKLGIEMLKLPVKIGINICTATYKDSVQLRNRFLNRAKNIARPFEILTEDGTIICGIIETNNLKKTEKILREKFGLCKKEYFVNTKKNRIEIEPETAEKIAKKTNLKCFIVENYPIYEEFEVERIPLPSNL